MEKRNEKTEKTTKRAEKDMKRTEFAQEYNFNNEKQDLRKSDKTGKTEKTNKNCHWLKPWYFVSNSVTLKKGWT